MSEFTIPPAALARLRAAHQGYIHARDKFNEMANVTAEAMGIDTTTPGISILMDRGVVALPDDNEPEENEPVRLASV